MAEPVIRVFSDLEALSRAAAQHFEDVAQNSLARRNWFSVGLSGGATPRRTYEILGSGDVPGRIYWGGIHFFQVDERCVPPGHAESNFRMLRETLLAGGKIPDASVHRMAAERPDRREACKDYARELAQILKTEEGEWPRLDFVFLGMGPDGHTASLFPGTEAVSERTLWVRENYIEVKKSCRLTLTLPVLNAAAEVLFLVSGAEKAERLRDVLSGPHQPDKYPAQGVRPERGNVSWYLDEAGARLLPAHFRHKQNA